MADKAGFTLNDITNKALIEMVIQNGNLDPRLLKDLKKIKSPNSITKQDGAIGLVNPDALSAYMDDVVFGNMQHSAENSQLAGSLLNQGGTGIFNHIYRGSRLADLANRYRLGGIIGRDLADSYSSWKLLNKVYGKGTDQQKQLLKDYGSLRSVVLPSKLGLKVIDEAPRTIGGHIGAKFLRGKRNPLSVSGAARTLLGDMLGGGLASSVSKPLKSVLSEPLKALLNSDSVKTFATDISKRTAEDAKNRDFKFK